MAEFFDLRPETIAFWLGFVAATIFWWVVLRVRPLLPRLSAAIKTRWQNLRRKSHDRADSALRQNALRRARQMHLAAPLFALDEILVEPALLAAPPNFSNPTNAPVDSVIDHVIPYLPDWPLFSAEYAVPSLTPARALETHPRIAIIGQPGSGKTVALARLAAQLADKDPACGALAGSLPVLLHVLDLTLEPAPSDPLEIIIRALNTHLPRLSHTQSERTLRFMTNTGQVALLMDGPDELPPAMLSAACTYLSTLTEKYPNLKIITTAAPEYLDGLVKVGFQPLGLRAWSSTQTEGFIIRWSEMWDKQIAPHLSQKTPANPFPDAHILSQWLLTAPQSLTPLEWTLKIWGLFAGDVRGADTCSDIETHFRRLTQDGVPVGGMAALAVEMLSQSNPAPTYSHLKSILSKAHLIQTPTQEQPAQPGKAAITRSTRVRSGALATLLDCGILVEHPGEKIRFTNPVFSGYLAALAAGAELTLTLPGDLPWSVAEETCRFLAAHDRATEILQRLLPVEDDPLFSGLLRASRWLKDAPTSATWRAGILRRLVTLAQRNSLPVSLRARFISAILAINEPSTSLLLKQFIASPSASTRRLGALAIGQIGSEKMLDDLSALASNSDVDTRAAAMIAISSSHEKRPLEIIQNALYDGEESLQLAAAEILARRDTTGQEALREALTTDQLMARRAAVYGLAHIHDAWAIALLEKVAVEDAQWVVRNAAWLALEQSRTGIDPYAPTPLPRPVDAPWLITFASKQGMGIPPDKPPTDLLLQALKSGSLEEKLGALTYLRLHPTEPIISAIRAAAEESNETLREAASYALWLIAASGFNVIPAKTPLY